jgi:sulfur carrier protein ThiS
MKVGLSLPRHFTDETKVTDEMELSDRSTILDLLRRLGLHPDEVLVLMDGSPVPDDRVLHDGDRVELLSIASGG